MNWIYHVSIHHVSPFSGGTTKRDFLVRSTGIESIRDWAMKWGRDREVYILEVTVTPRPDLYGGDFHSCDNCGVLVQH